MYVQNGNSCKTMLKRYFRDKRLARVEYVVNMERALLRARSAACSSYCLSRPLSSGCQTALEYAVRLDYVMPNWPLLTAEAALQFDFRPALRPAGTVFSLIPIALLTFLQ